MRYLGIDYGTKRIGLALSDESGTIVRTLTVLKNDSKLFAEIEKIIATEGVEVMVVGNSGENKVQTDINEFIGQITLVTMLPVEQVTEAFTSYEAHGRQGKEGNNARQSKAPIKPTNLDARAAAIILERFLERKNKDSK